MTVRRRTAAALAAAGIAAVGLWPAAPAQAHGTPVSPLSRTAACAGEEADSTAAVCRAARAANGAEFGSFDNLRLAGVNGKDRELIPDGQLCSAGLPAFKGLNLARADWPATRLTAGGTFDMRYRTTIPHPGSFRLYLTRAGYDPVQPLRWRDLDEEPMLTVADPPLRAGTYRMSGKLPADRTGRHLLYTVWQTTDSTDTYYSCSDVVLTAAGSAAVPGAAAPPKASPAGTDRDDEDGGGRAQGEANRPAGARRSATPAAPARPTRDAAPPVATEGLAAGGGRAAEPSGPPPAAGTSVARESWLGPAEPVAEDRISLGRQLVTAALVVLVGVACGLGFVRIRAARAQVIHSRPEKR